MFTALNNMKIISDFSKCYLVGERAPDARLD